MASTASFSPEYLAENRSHRLLVVAILFLVLQTSFFGLYVISRIVIKLSPGLDTYFMIPAFILCIGQPIIGILTITHGAVGRHVMTASLHELVLWAQLSYTYMFLYLPSVVFPKLSILCLYLRIFTTKPYRYAAYIISGMLILNWLVILGLWLKICTPLRFFWDMSIEGGTCLDQKAISIWCGFCNMLTDAMMLVLPLPVLWKLQVSKPQKIGLFVTFNTFSIGLITSAFRFQMVYRTDVLSDMTWYGLDMQMWTVVESGACFLAACLHSFRA